MEFTEITTCRDLIPQHGRKTVYHRQVGCSTETCITVVQTALCQMALVTESPPKQVFVYNYSNSTL